MSPKKNLYRQLIVDMDRLLELTHRYSRGDMSVKQEREQMAGAVDIKLALLKGMRKAGIGS